MSERYESRTDPDRYENHKANMRKAQRQRRKDNDNG